MLIDVVEEFVDDRGVVVCMSMTRLPTCQNG